MTHLFSNSLFSSSNFSQIKRKTSPGIQSLQEKTKGFKIALQKTEILPSKKHFHKKKNKKKMLVEKLTFLSMQMLVLFVKCENQWGEERKHWILGITGIALRKREERGGSFFFLWMSFWTILRKKRFSVCVNVSIAHSNGVVCLVRLWVLSARRQTTQARQAS